MINLLPPEETLAASELQDWFNTKTQITTLEFKNHLRTKFPNYYWNQVWASKFLMNQNLDFQDTGGLYRIYYAPNSFVENGWPGLEILFEKAIKTLEDNNIPITRKAIKKAIALQDYVIGDDFTQEDFDNMFKDSDLEPSGQYNGENHIIYVRVSSGKYHSRSKDTNIDIKNMHKSHLYNAIRKHYGDSVDDAIFDSTTKIYELLKAYYTWDLRQMIKNLQ